MIEMGKNRITIALLILLIYFWFQFCGNPVASSNFLDAPGPILFICTKSGTAQLYSINPEGSSVQQLTDDPKFPIVNAKWSPDGESLAIESPVGGVPIYGDAIYVENSDGGSRHLVTRKSTVILYDSTVGDTIAYRGALGLFWSPDSREIAYIRHWYAEPLYSSDIFVIDMNGKDERRITDSPKIEKELVDWSPDGNYLLALWKDDFHVDSTTGLPYRKDVLYDLQGKEVRSWKNGTGPVGPFSRDGARIATAQGGSVCTVNVDGSNAKLLATAPPGLLLYPVCWSPGDSDILCNGASLDVQNRIFVINAQTGSMKEITPFKNYDGYEFATDWRR